MKRAIRSSVVMPHLFGLVGGLLSSFAYPDHAIWLAIFPSVALILWAIAISPLRYSATVGFVAGFAFYASQIPWMTVYLGPVPWLALSFLEALIFAVGSFAIAIALDFFKRAKRSRYSSVALAISVASLWTAREWLACNFPYGGFPWSRVALSQSNSPLAPWVFWGGASALSFAIVFICALIVFDWQKLNFKNWRTSPTFLIALLVLAVPAMTPLNNSAEVGTLDVAA
ncbi:MAG: hypothetical protein RL149_790, partial [Actinomycetota bacterium]